MKRFASILLLFVLLTASLALAEGAESAGFVPMQKGSKGDDVQALQQRLILLGYLQGTADGKFGDMTRAAVEAVQHAHSLEITGVAGEDELDALSEEIREYAQRAVIVAMTNAQAEDVFAEDGSFDPARFHSYVDESGFYMTLNSEGAWIEEDRDAWRVENIQLDMAGYETCMWASMNVCFDGTSFAVSNVTYCIATPEDMDSGDPDKLREEEIEASEDTPFLTVAASLVMGERESEILAREAAAEQESAAERQRWIDDQFDAEDGSHAGVEALILEKLSAPESYEHVETSWVEIVDESTMTKINLVLQGSKFPQRVKVGNLFINTTFHVKDEEGAERTGIAYAIAEYESDSLTLLGIVGLEADE